jgi:hypothetical protein
MARRVACPFCNTAFETELPPGQRQPCPRCGETVLLPEGTSLLDEASTVAARPATEHAPPGNTRPAWKSAVLYLVSMVLLAVASTGIYLWLVPPKPPTPEEIGAAPPATKPPALLGGLRRLPASTNVAVALQPSALLQYAERKQQDPTQLLQQAGLPSTLFENLRKVGIPPEQVDHFVLGLAIGSEAIPSWSAVLVLRREIADEATFRREWKVKPNIDKPGWFAAELFGLPCEMTKPDDKTYLFASSARDLDAMAKRKPEGIEQLSAGLRNSIQWLSPASFFWVATDSEDWSKNKALVAFSAILKQPDWPKKLDGLRAIAAGLSMEPEMQMKLAVRTADTTTAKALTLKGMEALKAEEASGLFEGDWASWTLKFDPPQELMRVLRRVAESK